MVAGRFSSIYRSTGERWAPTSSELEEEDEKSFLISTELPSSRKAEPRRISLLLVSIFCISGLVIIAVLQVTSGGAAGEAQTEAEPTLKRNPHLLLHANGLAYVSPIDIVNGQTEHPIISLIANATAQCVVCISAPHARSWNALIARQSKTLEQAVAEYRRRHSRDPPANFDAWWQFAAENDVVLTDEYDQTVTDTLPFLSLPRDLLSDRRKEVERDETTFTLRVKNGKLQLSGAMRDTPRATDQRDMMAAFAKLLPDLSVTMSAADGPSVLLDARQRKRHLDAARADKVLSRAECEDLDDDPSLPGFVLACPEDSRLRRAYDGLETLPEGPSFVYDHVQAMDLCANPEWKDLHGFTSWDGPRPTRLMPLFAQAKLSVHSDILATPLEQFYDHFVKGDDVTWSKKINKARDSSTGVDKLVERTVDTAKLAKRYLDVKFAGDVLQCDDDGSCDAARRLAPFDKPMDWPTQNRYKYQIDIGGNGRFHRLLSSNSMIIKSSVFPEWYAQRIVPYVPVKVDYSDLWDILTFFAGDERGRNGHDDLAQRIAKQGKEFARSHWRIEDIQAYAFRLYLEWARATSDDPASMSFKL